MLSSSRKGLYANPGPILEDPNAQAEVSFRKPFNCNQFGNMCSQSKKMLLIQGFFLNLGLDYCICEKFFAGIQNIEKQANFPCKSSSKLHMGGASRSLQGK